MDHSTKKPNPARAADDSNTIEELTNVPRSSAETGVFVNRPGAYHVYLRSQPPPEANRDIVDDSEVSQQSVVAVDCAEVYNEEDERLRLLKAIQEAREAGHKDGRQELALTAVQAVPVAGAENNGDQHQDRAKYPPSVVVLVSLALVLVIVVAVVVPVTLTRKTTSRSSLATTPSPFVSPTRQVQCFENETLLLAAVDAYLESALANSAYGLVYGFSITHWCVSTIRAFDELFSVGRNPLAAHFDGNLSGWDVSNAVSMAGMFYKANSFHGFGLENWNVSSLQNATAMFSGSTLFDADLSGWDVSHVTDMSGMFQDASGFRGPGLKMWKVKNVLAMSSMFSDATLFNANLSRWDVSRVISMHSMFTTATNFTGVGLDYWNVSKVVDMGAMFSGASAFDTNFSQWDVSKVNSMNMMFATATNLRGIGLHHWNVSSVIDMTGMFWGASSFDNNLSSWDVSKVRSMTAMFSDCTSFTGVGLDHWNVSNAISMSAMFWGASTFDANLSQWDVSQVQDMNGMFRQATKFTGIGVENWNVSSVETMTGTFGWASSFDNDLSMWNVSNVQLMNGTFAYAANFTGIGLEDWNVSSVYTMGGMFWGASSFDANLSKWDVRNVQYMTGMFSNATNFTGIGLDHWNISSVTDTDIQFAYSTGLAGMFWGASSFDSNLSKWDVSKIQNMGTVFMDATSFTGIGLDRWNVSSAILMIAMFWGASSFDANLSQWDVSQVANMNAMFRDATNFTGTGLENWNVSSVEDMTGMFRRASSFNGNLSQWDVSEVRQMNSLFGALPNILTPFSPFHDMNGLFADAVNFMGIGLDLWDVSNIVDMSCMFAGASFFDTNLSKWNVSRVSNMNYMFQNATMFAGSGLEHWDVSKVNDAAEMFHGATSFSNNLCSWGHLLRLLDANTTLMFAGTMCPSDASPNLSLKQPSPFCYKC